MINALCIWPDDAPRPTIIVMMYVFCQLQGDISAKENAQHPLGLPAKYDPRLCGGGVVDIGITVPHKQTADCLGDLWWGDAC